MSRRICLSLFAVSFALAAPGTSLAQSSSQAQYQGVAPETSTPVTGSGGSTGGSGANATTPSGGGGTGGATGTAGTTSGASGNGGSGANAPAASGAGQSGSVAVTPQATSDTTPFSGGDFVWILLAVGGLVGLGFVLRRATRQPTGV